MRFTVYIRLALSILDKLQFLSVQFRCFVAVKFESLGTLALTSHSVGMKSKSWIKENYEGTCRSGEWSLKTHGCRKIFVQFPFFSGYVCLAVSIFFFFFNAVLKFHFVFSRLRKSSSPDLFVGFYKK